MCSASGHHKVVVWVVSAALQLTPTRRTDSNVLATGGASAAVMHRAAGRCARPGQPGARPASATAGARSHERCDSREAATAAHTHYGGLSAACCLALRAHAHHALCIKRQLHHNISFRLVSGACLVASCCHDRQQSSCRRWRSSCILTSSCGRLRLRSSVSARSATRCCSSWQWLARALRKRRSSHLRHRGPGCAVSTLLSSPRMSHSQCALCMIRQLHKWQSSARPILAVVASGSNCCHK